jgi:diadenosine tetraphosphate (Ap4A) HIT family hydrolase
MDGVNVNTLLGGSGNFLIVPALGPLVVGHVLLITDRHTPGLQYLPAKIQRDYGLLAQKLREYCARFGDTVLEAEHGAPDGSIRGACIRHTHVHFLPGLGNAARTFDSKSELEDIHGKDLNPTGPYLWINNGNNTRVYDASRAMGQEIRRTIGQYLAIDDWDWAVAPKTALIALTIEYWRDLKNV